MTRSNTLQATVTVVVGTRPEIIKMAPIIRGIQSSETFHLHLVHTGQHYDQELSQVFFDDLRLPAPDENLSVGSGSQGEQTAEALVELESSIECAEPQIVLAQGDTNAVLSTALASSKMANVFGHVEAGIRSFDRSMPEEVNRVVADHVSDVLFAPTKTAAKNLAAEGIEDHVFVTGNTVVDACLEHVQFAEEHADVFDWVGVVPGEYALATVHRPINTDSESRLRTIVEALEETNVPVVLPAHPRTSRALDRVGIDAGNSVHVVEPLDYLAFLAVEKRARFVVTDSGGVQEEASILEVPCLTVRPNTERPETVEAGVNVLVSPEELADAASKLARDESLRETMRGCPNLYGNGNAADTILDILHRYVPDRSTGRDGESSS